MVETRGGRRFAILFFVLAFAILLFGRWLKPVDNVAVTVFAPFASVVDGVSTAIGDTITGVVEGPRLRQENQQFQHQIAQLMARNLTMQEALHENQFLSRMLNFDNHNNRYDLLTARVIANDPNTLGQYAIINRGSRDGLKPGMTVISQDTYFAGAIVSVLPTASKVQLMLSPSSGVGAYDMQTRAQGVVIGQYDGRPQLKFVPTSAKLAVGDFIVTSGQANLFPRGLLLGQITAVHRRSEEPIQTADIQPATDFGNMELVQVVRNQPPVPFQLLNSP